MRHTEKIHIVVAETSPVISSGFSFCLRRLPGLQAQTIETHTYPDLINCLRNNPVDIVVVNPNFGGAFAPQHLRETIETSDLKIVAIEISPIDRPTRSLYDDVVSIVEDLPSMAEKMRKLAIGTTESEPDKEPLSTREKEIITLVVKGMTNKEIADRLFLSIHTVMTHRRNIARKLEIHSATGLTIYAIVNHLVDLTEIKL